MHSRLVLGCLLALLPALSAAQVPVAELAQPPAGARHYIIGSTGGKHGDSWSWVGADGSRMGPGSLNLRGQAFVEAYRGTPRGRCLARARSSRGSTLSRPATLRLFVS